MDRADLELVVALHRWGSLTAAAEHLHIAQPALSRRLGRLEHDVGDALFVRGPRGMRATPAGRTLAERAATALAAIRRAEQDTADVVAGTRGRLRLGTTPTLGADLLPDVLALARADQPSLQLDLAVNGDSSVLLDDLRNGDLDIAFATLAAADLSGLDVAAAGPQRFVLVVPSGHPLARLKVVTHHHLAHEPMVTLVGGQGLRTVVDTVLAGIGTEPVISIETPERELLIPFVTAGLGLTIVPEVFGRQRAGPGVEIRPLRPAVTRDVGAVIRTGVPSELLGHFASAVHARWPHHR
jgi:DNA-binding transcriptional LysR family regulator